MRKSIILTFVLSLLSLTAAIGQNSRLVQGVVQASDGQPLVGALVKESGGANAQISSVDGGRFELRVSPYSTILIVSFDGYLPAEVEIDGSYLIVRLKVDKKYAERVAQKEAEARMEAQREAEAKAKAEEDARIAAEKEAAAKAQAEEDARIAAEKEAAAKAKAEEDARIAAEKEAAAKAKAEEAARIAAEKEAAAKAKAEELARIEAKKIAEREEKNRLAKIAQEQRRADIRKQSKGFGSLVDVSYMGGSTSAFSNLGLTYTAGYRFNNLVYLGAGAGVKFNFDGEEPDRKLGVPYPTDFLSPATVSLPVYAYFKANFINRRFSPYFAMAAGANLSKPQNLHLELCDISYPTHNIFVNPQLGINLRTTTQTSISLSVGMQCMTAPRCVEYTGYNATIRSAYMYGLDFHLGFMF